MILLDVRAIACGAKYQSFPLLSTGCPRPGQVPGFLWRRNIFSRVLWCGNTIDNFWWRRRSASRGNYYPGPRDTLRNPA